MSAVDEADAAARRGFTPKADPERQDRWRSHYDDVMAGRSWEGDCDDLGSTFLDLLGRQHGIPEADLYAMVVMSTGGLHYVGCAHVDGIFYIGGDALFPGAYRAPPKHTTIKYRRLSEPPDLWRDGAPFEDAVR